MFRACLLALLLAIVSAPVSATEILISAAASLREALTESARPFETNHPEIRLQLNFGASGALAEQIENGAPASLFLSAGPKPIERLIDSGRARPDSRKALFANQLVLIWSRQSQPATHLAGLASNNVSRVAMGEPRSVPAGLYARQTLEKSHLWTAVADKIVFAKDVRQVLAFVESGDAEAGFIYTTDAIEARNIGPVVPISSELHDPILYEAVLIRDAANIAGARSFLDYLASETGAAPFLARGFRRPQ